MTQVTFMKRKNIFIAIALIALVVALSLSNASAAAKPAATYTVDWYTVASGGTTNAAGGTYALSGTIGQFDVGSMSGGSYQLNGGFWEVVNSLRQLFLPLIVR